MKSKAYIKLNRIPGLVALVFIATQGTIWAEPELKTLRPDGPARVNVNYPITYEITWTGDAAQYAVLPPKVDSIDWGTVSIGPATSFVRDGVNVVSQIVNILPTKPGEYTSPKTSFPYLNPEATPPAEKAVARTDPPDSSASPSLGAEPFTLVVRPAGISFRNSGGLGASLLLLLLLVVAFFMTMRRVRGRNKRFIAHDNAAPFFSTIQSSLHVVRQHRLDGKFYEFYLELAQIADQLSRQAKSQAAANESAALAAALKGRAQEVGYKGIRPNDDQLSGDFRDLERAVARVKEEANQ